MVAIVRREAADTEGVERISSTELETARLVTPVTRDKEVVRTTPATGTVLTPPTLVAEDLAPLQVVEERIAVLEAVELVETLPETERDIKAAATGNLPILPDVLDATQVNTVVWLDGLLLLLFLFQLLCDSWIPRPGIILERLQK